MRKYGFLRSPEYANIPERKIEKAKLTGLPKRYYLDSTGPVKNQGPTNKCVPYSLMSCLEHHYKIRKKELDINPNFIYDKRRNSDSDEGMFIYDAMEILKQNNLIKIYGKLVTIDAVKAAIFLDGPVIAGLPVKSPNDQFWIGSEFVGGHAVALIGYDEDSFIIKNSWGYNYGSSGEEPISYSHLSKSAYELWTIVY